jgi:hypothetical protein
MQLAHVSRCRKFAAAGYVTILRAYVFEVMIANREEIDMYAARCMPVFSDRNRNRTRLRRQIGEQTRRRTQLLQLPSSMNDNYAD